MGSVLQILAVLLAICLIALSLVAAMESIIADLSSGELRYAHLAISVMIATLALVCGF